MKSIWPSFHIALAVGSFASVSTFYLPFPTIHSCSIPTTKFLSLLRQSILAISFFLWISNSCLYDFMFHSSGIFPLKWNFPRDRSLTVMNYYTFCLENNDVNLTIKEWWRLAAKCRFSRASQKMLEPVKAEPREIQSYWVLENRTGTFRTLANVFFSKGELMWNFKPRRKHARKRGARESKSYC